MNKFRANCLKTRIEYSRYGQNSTKNKEKCMLIYNKNTLLLFLTTFRCKKNFLKFENLLARMVTKVHP